MIFRQAKSGRGIWSRPSLKASWLRIGSVLKSAHVAGRDSRFTLNRRFTHQTIHAAHCGTLLFSAPRAPLGRTETDSSPSFRIVITSLAISSARRVFAVLTFRATALRPHEAFFFPFFFEFSQNATHRPADTEPLRPGCSRRRSRWPGDLQV